MTIETELKLYLKDVLLLVSSVPYRISGISTIHDKALCSLLCQVSWTIPLKLGTETL